MKVFVYGTLKSGYGNNRLLDGQTFLESSFLNGYKMFYSGGVGSFPCIIPDKDSVIRGEVWDIGEDMDCLQRLDWLEGHPRMYKRTTEFHPYHNDLEVYVWNYPMNDKYVEVPKNSNNEYEWSRT